MHFITPWCYINSQQKYKCINSSTKYVNMLFWQSIELMKIVEMKSMTYIKWRVRRQRWLQTQLCSSWRWCEELERDAAVNVMCVWMNVHIYAEDKDGWGHVCVKIWFVQMVCFMMWMCSSFLHRPNAIISYTQIPQKWTPEERTQNNLITLHFQKTNSSHNWACSFLDV